MNVEQIDRVAIVGTGIMGTGIALTFARAGYQVTAIDTRQDRLDRARNTLRVACDELVQGGLLRSSEVERILGRVWLTLGGDEPLSSADYVTEAVPEILDLKQQVFERCGILCRAGTVVASNTSTMSISEIAARMKHPERAVVTHWFIPPHLMPVVEVVPGTGTSEQTVQLTKALLQKLGKRPVVCKENPGFIHNYIQLAMTRAAMLLVERGGVFSGRRGCRGDERLCVAPCSTGTDAIGRLRWAGDSVACFAIHLRKDRRCGVPAASDIKG